MCLIWTWQIARGCSSARQGGIHHGDTETRRRSNHRWTRMDTDRNGKPDLTKESSTKEGAGEVERKVETSKYRKEGTKARRHGGT